MFSAPLSNLKFFIISLEFLCYSDTGRVKNNVIKFLSIYLLSIKFSVSIFFSFLHLKIFT